MTARTRTLLRAFGNPKELFNGNGKAARKMQRLMRRMGYKV